MKVLFVGDVHGNTPFMRSMIAIAADNGIDTLMQVGDFGFWPHTASGQEFLAATEKAAAKAGVTVWWIDGNHENHSALGGLTRGSRVLLEISPHIKYLPRGCRWEWDGVRFGALGGAFSVDWRARRVGTSWWPDEVITDNDVVALGSETLDVLITHDCPPGLDLASGWQLRRDDQAVCDAQRELIAEAIAATSPRLLIHGHWHLRHEAVLESLRVIGLGCDGDGADAYLVLDLADVERHAPPLL
jgi:predicted phosphodiesterase